MSFPSPLIEVHSALLRMADPSGVERSTPISPRAAPAALPGQARDCLAGGGRMGALMRAFDWSSTPLGPVDTWPQSLRTAVSIMLASGFPMLVVWGREYIQLYNDAYRPVLGATKHPAALGQRAPECWPEIWDDVLGPMFGQVMAGGEPIWSEDLAFFLDRNGYLEETYFTFSYSAIRDESGSPGGVLVTCVETTDRVIGERRLQTLRELAAQAAASQSVDAACRTAVATLARNLHDIPFALAYLFDGSGGEARLAATSGLHGPSTISWPIAGIAETLAPAIVTDLGGRLGAMDPWPEPVDAAAAVPIAHAGRGEALGVLVAGISPRRAYDGRYQDFLTLVASQIAAVVTNAQAHEAERERAEALAQIDRAKTAFFSNVSHEFRTPLTLIVGPTEDLLQERHGSLTDAQRQHLEVLHRNAGRLLKLVNALLDFSRIEAGRVQASYRRTDLAALTRDVAAAFRSVIQQAGLRFEVRCDPIDAPAYVDRDMWEKVVLNLLSNAFKFTFEGTITVDLRAEGEEIVLAVRDTGVGIPEAELSRVFDRFHRIERTRARTHEGSGIGLALTHELVRLHGGQIGVESRTGAGSIFTVRIPSGCAHLPADRIDAEPSLHSTAVGVEPFVAEAEHWLPSGVARAVVGGVARDAPPAPRAPGARIERILVVDDNADMRDYLSRLLGEWTVETAADGAAALALATASPPDLVVTDVMMPGLDGFELLAALRAGERTRSTPVLMLSARAGEEARVSGLGAGADDYLTKPFSARELTARVRSQLAIARARREAEAANRTKDEFLAMLGHELRNPLAPILTALQLMHLRGETTAERERTVIDRQVRHLVRLVDDLLDVSRIARGKIELRRQPVEIAEVVASAIEATSPLLEERRHELNVDVPRAGLAVDGDLTRLRQVVCNLLTNAAKYTEPRGRITIAAARAGGAVELRVTDTGIGLAPEMLPSLFEMFSQGPQAIDRAHGGLGLGLTIVRSLVALHGGTVQAHSDGIGRGSEFVIRLPALEISAATAGDHASASRPAGIAPRSGRRVLVVDDNVDAAHLIAEVLESVGHDTRVAFDGPAALDLLPGFRPDLALLDIGLPLMDGYELARQLVALNGRRRPLLVAVTGYGQSSDHERSRDAGFDAHVVKPVDVDELIALVDRLLAGRSDGAPVDIADPQA
jgi:signal transduction histidine kinase